jgi:hypothetical protein
VRKSLYACASLAVACGALALLFAPSRGGAGPAEPPPDAPPAAPAQLPIKQVVLFSSGVGYFQREGPVEGEAHVDLSFPVNDVNDLLKSMVLRDLDGGHISAVSYDSSAPVERTLRSFGVDLTGSPTFADLLQQARGQKVEVSLANASTLTGSVIGVERQRLAPGKDGGPAEVAMLNLRCADGLRSVKLSDVQRVRLLSAALDSELRKALDTLALSRDTQKKAVRVRCVGEGRRRVRVGYVVESPVWKTSYRLVLPSPKSKGQKKPYLQGWAVVENPSDEDWTDVGVTLVSGRPISFKMDLYQPLYVQRPEERLELLAGLRSVVHDGAVPEAARVNQVITIGNARSPAPTASAPPGVTTNSATPPAPAGAASADDRQVLSDYVGVQREQNQQMNLGASVTAAASAAKLGDFFRYAIDRPVSLARQKSALLPIVGQEIEAERLAVYNAQVHAKFPLLAVRVKNTTGLHLMQGPVTVFEGASYAGDARILDVQPGEERLLSYAVDLGTEVSSDASRESGAVLTVRVAKGVMHTTVKTRIVRTYKLTNRNEAPRAVLVEHPITPSMRLTGPKPRETTRDLYRFEVAVPAGQTKELKVVEERDDHVAFAVGGEHDERLALYLRGKACSKAVKDGLRKAMELRAAVAKTQREIAAAQGELAAIALDQKRLRANLKEMPKDARAYKRYLEKFDRQETRIEKREDEVKALLARQAKEQAALEEFLASFSAE